MFYLANQKRKLVEKPSFSAETEGLALASLLTSLGFSISICNTGMFHAICLQSCDTSKLLIVEGIKSEIILLNSWLFNIN